MNSIAKTSQKIRKMPVSLISESIIDQTKAFTAPRGHLEMGGLLIGHVDKDGNNICVTGFFPEQIQATPGYCEFDGKWMIIAAEAIRIANEFIIQKSSNSPKIRIIGWIHTHPDLGIFLSGTDIKTYKHLLNFSPDGRFMAVVVDPLRNEHGIFTDPNKPKSYYSAKDSFELSRTLKDGYSILLEEIERKRKDIGESKIPFILTGKLRKEHISKGYKDDELESKLNTIYILKKEINNLNSKISDFQYSLENSNNNIMHVNDQLNQIEYDSKIFKESYAKNSKKQEDEIFNLTSEMRVLKNKLDIKDKKLVSDISEMSLKNDTYFKNNHYKILKLNDEIKSINQKFQQQKEESIKMNNLKYEYLNIHLFSKKTWEERENEEWSEFKKDLCSPQFWKNSDIYEKYFALISQNPKMAKLAFKRFRGRSKSQNIKLNEFMSNVLRYLKRFFIKLKLYVSN
jgi:proteasome lid subunit RPN8/RPN11